MATRGRPSSYKPEYAAQARKMCEAFGATDLELADFFGVTRETINQWRRKHSKFADALKSGKEAADERVERRLYEKATGYTHDAVKIFMPQGAPQPVYAPYREHVPPDTTACIFWLKNRRSEEWRDSKHMTGDVRHDHHHHLSREAESVVAEALAGLGGEKPKANGEAKRVH